MAEGIIRPMILLLGLMLIGCNGARYIVKNQDSGVVAIPSNTDYWPTYNRSRALKLIEEHCPNGFDIEREEEYVTGTVTTQHTETDNDYFGPFIINEAATTSTSHYDQTEWRIYYKARNNGAGHFPVGNPIPNLNPPPQGEPNQNLTPVLGVSKVGSENASVAK